MKKVKISIIAAISENRALGKGGKLLWRIPEDLKRFKKLTEGHVVIMGRKTFESIGKPLLNRINIVITRDKSLKPRYASSEIEKQTSSRSRLTRQPRLTWQDRTITILCYSFEEAIKNSKFEIRNLKLPNEIFIIGGGQIYQQAMKYADRLYLTIVKGKFEADTFFPDYSDFKKVVAKRKLRDDNYKYTFLELKK